MLDRKHSKEASLLVHARGHCYKSKSSVDDAAVGMSHLQPAAVDINPERPPTEKPQQFKSN